MIYFGICILCLITTVPSYFNIQATAGENFGDM